MRKLWSGDKDGKTCQVREACPAYQWSSELWIKYYIGLYEIVHPNLELFSLCVTNWSVTREKKLLILFLNFRLYNFVSGLTLRRIARISQQNKFKLNRKKKTAVGRPRKRNPSTDSVSLICQQVPVVLILLQATGDTDMRCTVEDTHFRQNREGNKKKG